MEEHTNGAAIAPTPDEYTDLLSMQTALAEKKRAVLAGLDAKEKALRGELSLIEKRRADLLGATPATGPTSVTTKARAAKTTAAPTTTAPAPRPAAAPAGPEISAGEVAPSIRALLGVVGRAKLGDLLAGVRANKETVTKVLTELRRTGQIGTAGKARATEYFLTGS